MMQPQPLLPTGSSLRPPQQQQQQQQREQQQQLVVSGRHAGLAARSGPLRRVSSLA